MFKKILVPTDASEYSRRALKSALELARQLDAEVILLHVAYNPEAYLSFAVSYGISVTHEQMKKSGEAALAATLTGIDTEGVALSQKLAFGYPAGTILDEIKNGIELVVMGSHGYGPLTGSMLGSVSQRVLSHAKCPVLIVK